MDLLLSIINWDQYRLCSSTSRFFNLHGWNSCYQRSFPPRHHPQHHSHLATTKFSSALSNNHGKVKTEIVLWSVLLSSLRLLFFFCRISFVSRFYKDLSNLIRSASRCPHFLEREKQQTTWCHSINSKGSCEISGPSSKEPLPLVSKNGRKKYAEGLSMWLATRWSVSSSIVRIVFSLQTWCICRKKVVFFWINITYIQKKLVSFIVLNFIKIVVVKKKTISPTV